MCLPIRCLKTGCITLSFIRLLQSNGCTSYICHDVCFEVFAQQRLCTPQYNFSGMCHRNVYWSTQYRIPENSTLPNSSLQCFYAALALKFRVDPSKMDGDLGRPQNVRAADQKYWQDMCIVCGGSSAYSQGIAKLPFPLSSPPWSSPFHP
jgi:hypothetical protein